MNRPVFATDTASPHRRRELNHIGELCFCLFLVYLTTTNMCRNTYLIKHVCLYSHAFPPSPPLSSFPRFCLSHMVSLSQPGLIKDLQTVYMHQITPHALCSTAYVVVLQTPSFLVFPPFPCSRPDYKFFAIFEAAHSSYSFSPHIFLFLFRQFCSQ